MDKTKPVSGSNPPESKEKLKVIPLENKEKVQDSKISSSKKVTKKSNS